MAILPPAVLTLLLDGRPVRSYEPLYLTRGRVLGPVDPYLTRVAERIEHIGGLTIFVRGGRHVSVRLTSRVPGNLAQTYVALVPILRALGERVDFDAARSIIEVRSPMPLDTRTPKPFNATTHQIPQRVIFTPTPVPTLRPVWNGTPRPRRTPIPIEAWATPRPTPQPHR